MNSRKKQAIATRKRIFDSAVSLMQKHGFEETTIEQICKKAKVSVGSFYNYFKSKHDVITAVYESADHYFENIVAPELEPLSFEDKILDFFAHYAKYNVRNGIDFVRRLYGNSENKLFIDKDRFMHKLLHNVLLAAKELGVLTSRMSVGETEQFMFLLARGVVGDWCLYDGAYELEDKMRFYFTQAMPVFVNQS